VVFRARLPNQKIGLTGAFTRQSIQKTRLSNQFLGSTGALRSAVSLILENVFVSQFFVLSDLRSVVAHLQRAANFEIQPFFHPSKQDYRPTWQWITHPASQAAAVAASSTAQAKE